MEVWALQRSDSFTKEEWQEIQVTKLRNILTHAGKNVPYWNTIFREYNFLRELRTIEDLRELPILTRKNFKQLPRSLMTAQNVSPRRFSQAATSGSTGEPFHFFQDKYDIFRRQIGIIKEFLNFGIRMDRPLLILGLSTHRQVTPFGERFIAEDMENDERRKKIYKFLIEKRPFAATGTSTLLLRFASFAEKDGFSYTFQKIRYTGEHMTDGEKEQLSRVFNTTLFTQYGTRECSYIGMECVDGKLHLTPWINLIEIVDTQGEPVSPGIEGEIVVTYFENFVMPFIRYDIGDRGKLLRDPCSCGRDTPIIEFTGRTSGMIELPDGKQIPILRITTKIATDFDREITRFQIEQSDMGSFIFRFIAAPSHSPATDASLLKYFDDTFQDKLKCTLEKVIEILPNESGKIPIFIKKF